MASVLDDIPDTLTGPAAWLGSEMAGRPSRWLYRLQPQEITDLEQAAAKFLATGRDMATMTAEDFPLILFDAHLAYVRRDLMQGPGIMLLRGLPVQRYDRQTAAAIFCGIGVHLGRPRPQNAQGHLLGHVRDTGARPDDPEVRIYQTAARQSFHTDSADAVGLLCLQAAKSGGRSLVVSAETIYNQMRFMRPGLLERLFDPIATDRRGEVPPGAAPFVEIPVFSWHDGRLTVFYQRQYIESAQRHAGAMRLTDDHIAALDLFDLLANDPKLHLEMELIPGDMQFVYNHAMLHDRTAFLDWPEPARRRHLLRLWLALPGDRALPECFAQRYGSVEVGARGGVALDDVAPVAVLEG